ncbi:GNAT family N-acetyltransferase [Thermoflexus sp.]
MVAEVAGKVIGAVPVGFDRDGRRELTSVGVDPAWQGRGSGAGWCGR